jgi:trans-aconitate 2-methyltransferase
MRWDPAQYLRFSDERARPFHDLVDRVGATAARHVVDIGCGPGTLTALLAQRWPGAIVDGLDCSPDMISAAAPLATGRLRFAVADAHDWTLPDDVDVLISNATLQWVPEHRSVLQRWAGRLRPDGWLAFQVPGNFDAPSHVLLRQLAADPRYDVSGALAHHGSVGTPSAYAELLLDAGLQADCWETTYAHVLRGTDPVLEWLRGTGLRPVLAALPAELVAPFEAEFADLLRTAYPPGQHGTLFEFRRIFAVAHRKP